MMKAQFEVKQKTLAALNKLSDRDTFQLASEQLQSTAESLTAETLWPFLSCLADSDSSQKPALRRECLRLMAAAASAHPSLAAPHLPKLVAAVLRRLRDPDAGVRGACVHAAAAFSSAIGDSFAAVARPMFEALAEHDKNLQSGAALSLAAVIRHTCDAPIPSSVLRRMLCRTTKMLSNPHFLAKPALAELNAVLIQAGGAGGGEKSVSAAMAAIEACLKSSDWPTRKAASEALGELGGLSWLGPFRAGCVRSLECCRFDKVKPVRDSVSNALRCWTSALPQTPSESASSLKHRFSGDFSDVTSKPPRESGFKGVTGTNTTVKKRVPFSLSNKPRTSKANKEDDDWLVEIAVPKTRSNRHKNEEEEEEEEESECSSSVTKNFERMSAEYVDDDDDDMDDDDKREGSSVSVVVVTDKFETKLADKVVGGVPKMFERFSSQETCSVEQIYSNKTRDRTSLDSTVTESASTGSPLEDDMAFIRKQLLLMEEKQSSLMGLFQAFSTGVMDNLAVLQSRMARLEDAVARNDERSNLAKQIQTMNTHTPRPSSVYLRARKPSQLSLRDNATERRSTATKRDADMWSENNNNARTASHGDNVFGSAPRKSGFESKHSVWKRVKGFLCEGDVESAYAEALCFGDELILAELMDSTGPVLECLSSRNVNDVLATLASYLAQHKFTASVFPWLQQVVDLSNTHGTNHIVLTTKSRQKLSSALQEALRMDFSNPLEKRCISQIAVKLHHIWGNGS